MDINEAVKNRRSIRRFLPEKVPEDTIRELINDALWVPSWGNTQQYEFVVATGDALERFKKENRDALMSGLKPEPDVTMPEKWPETLKKRYVDVGKSVLTSLSIPREDKIGRMNYYGDMFFLFNATALLIVVVDKDVLLEYAMLDVGIFIQTFKLLAHARGLGTISLAASVSYPQIIRRIFNVPESSRIIMGTALGWPDIDSPVNNFERKRDPVDMFVRWVS
ncbi:MAG: nitroreductase [Proteobacteria bacterium]|nr:nitroreductase [Pseudomonadota bacterium]